ncbi:MAG: ubiquitin-like domain-containing protein [Anoxybacillus gonensis]|nr:ubiquitin-like domain-containing protein [Anoxybacillus gonensis]
MITYVKNLLQSTSKKKIALATGGFLALSGMTGYASYEWTKETVTLYANGKEEKVRTHANTVAELLKEQNIQLKQEDFISPSPKTKIVDHLTVKWEASKPIVLVVDGGEKRLRTTAKTVKDVLHIQQIQLRDYDEISPNVDEKVKDNMKIVISKAFPITLNDGGKQQQVWSTSTTVADFLAKQHITLRELDRVQPKLNDMIQPNTKINIVRVEKVTDVVEEPVNYTVVKKKDAQLEKGKQKVISEGEKGLVAKQYEVILENGKEVSRKLIKTETIKQSKNRIVAIGTKQVPRILASRGSGEVADELYVIRGGHTAYCGGCSGTTATGVNLRSNPNAKVIAVDPRVIPLGTKVYVEGYGYAVAADTGANVRGYKIDVFFPDKSTAYRWGTKRVKIKILK